MSSARTHAPGRLALRVEQARWEFGLPDGARRLIASGDFDGRTNDSLVRWLASDPQLTERLLRWCNTPLYNLSRPYASLQEASVVMDGRDLARLAVLAFVRGLFMPDSAIEIYSSRVALEALDRGRSGRVDDLSDVRSGRSEPGLCCRDAARHWALCQ